MTHDDEVGCREYPFNVSV